ncbi:MAG TPA: HAD family phosphatase [Candidatus Saccharimonadales bacterium]|nr:HAD family phosphatase [Candidatus Saccharimonadales bacterium]
MVKGSKFAVFDIDGTLIRWQLYHAIADNLVKLGFIAPVKFQAIKDARMVWKRRESSESFKKYELELVKLYDNILSEITVEQFEKTAEAVFEEYKDQVYTYTRDFIRQLKSQGYLLFAISGSQTQIIEKIAMHYGFDDFVAREDKSKDNKFTGEATTPIFSKDTVLKKMAMKNGASFEDSIAVGDSATDIKMLELVEQPIAFNPESKLFDYSKRKGWKVVIERKNMIYELEKIDGKYELVKTSV